MQNDYYGTLGLDNSPYAERAARFLMTGLAANGETARFNALAGRAGAGASSPGAGLLLLASEAASFAGEYSGEVLDWAFRKRPGDPEGAISLVRFIEGGGNDPFAAPSGPNDPFIRWLAEKLSSGAESTVKAVDTLSVRLRFSAEYERLSGRAETGTASGTGHWRQYIDPAVAASLGIDFGAATNVPPPLASGDPDGRTQAGPRAAANWIEGLAADASAEAQKHTASLNAAFLAWNSLIAERLDASNPAHDGAAASAQAGAVYLASPETAFDESLVRRAPPQLQAEYRRARSEYEALAYRHDKLSSSLARLGAAIATASNEGLLSERLAALGLEIDAARTAQSGAMDGYRAACEAYDASAALYDAAYAGTKMLYGGLEETRHLLEKEEAIQRWAGSAYLAASGDDDQAARAYRSPAAELDYAQASLSRSTEARLALAGLYNDGSDSRPYLDPEHQAALNAYQLHYQNLRLAARARSALGGALEKEYQENDRAYEAYRASLGGAVSFNASGAANYGAYEFPGRATAGWSDLLTIKADGRLGIAFDSGFRLTELDSAKASILYNYFTSPDVIEGGIDFRASTRYERELRDWSGRVSTYLSDCSRFETWALAREHLIGSLVAANPEFTSLASTLGRAENLYATVGRMNHQNNTVGGLIDAYKAGELAVARKLAWESLGSEERSDLEFLVVLGLSGGAPDINRAFAAHGQRVEYEKARMIADERIAGAMSASKAFTLSGMAFWTMGLALSWTPAGPVFLGMATVQFGLAALANADASEWRSVKITNIDPQLSAMAQASRTELGAFETRLGGLNSAYGTYTQSCSRIARLKGVPSGGTAASAAAALAGFRTSIENMGTLDRGEVDSLVVMYSQYQSATGRAFTGAADALGELCLWKSSLRDEARSTLERSYAEDEKTRLARLSDYRTALSAFMADGSGRDGLEDAAAAAFGSGAASAKTHLKGVAQILADQSASQEGDTVDAESVEAMRSLAGLVVRAQSTRQAGEMAAREAEWEALRYELRDKRQSWLEASSLLLERGRAAFDAGADTLRERANAWSNHFSDEYAARKPVWELARADMLDAKLRWVRQADEAAAESSAVAILSLVGSDAEAAARKMDSFFVTPINVDHGATESFEEVLSLAGIVKLEQATRLAAGGLIAGETSLPPVLLAQGSAAAVLRGSGGILASAAMFAEKSRESLAGIQARLLASRARETVALAARGLEESISSANINFENSMDEVFVYGGAWKRQGSSYVKDVVVHSTLGVPLITESANVGSYTHHVPGAWNPRTDLSDGRLSALDSAGIRALVAVAQDELRARSDEVFGKPEDNGSEALAARSERFDVYRPERGIVETRTLSWTDDEGGTRSRSVDIYGIKHIFDHTETRSEGAGSLGRYIGYAPVVQHAPDPDASMESIFLSMGKGELGRLMSAFIYWSLKEGKGWAEVAKPLYEKDLWDDRETWLKAPTLRSVADIGVGVAAMALSGGTALPALLGAGINLADDAIFGLLDAQSGYKSWEAVGLEFGKKTLASAVNVAGGQFFSGALANADKLTGISKIIGTSTIQGMRTITNNATTSAINALYWNGNGIGFSSSDFASGIEGGFISAATGFAGSIVTGGLNLGLEGFTGGVYENGKTLSNFAGGLASQSLNYALTGEASFNLVNIGMLGMTGSDGRLVTGGLLELQLGRNGLSMALGTGGMDASLGTIAASLAGLEAWGVNARMAFSGQAEAATYASALRTLYSAGSAASDERNLFERLLAGQTDIVETGSGDYRARTVYNAVSGTHTISLGADALSDGSRFGMNILLAHEAYRNGIDDGDGIFGDGQTAETRLAVLGHIQTAAALGASYGFDALSSPQLAELAAIQAACAGNTKDIAGILGSYDSGGDFWLVKVNGTIEDTPDRAFYREYIDADGNVRKEKVAGSEYDGSRTLALYNFLEKEMVDDMRTSHSDNLDRFDPAIVKDVLGWDTRTLRLAIKDGVSVADLSPQLQQKLKIEQLLGKHGYVYSDEKGQWVGAGMEVPGLQQNESIGIRLVDGVWEKFTVGMTITRDSDAYAVYRDGVASELYAVKDSADVSFYKRNLDTGLTEFYHPDYAWASIDKIPGNSIVVGEHTYEGNSIVSEWFRMHLTEFGGSDYGVSTVGVFTDAQILSGETLNKGGWRAGFKREARWLMHPFGTGAGSDGCIGPMSNDGIAEWNNPTICGTGAYNFTQILNKFSDWGVYKGYELSVRMLGQRRP